MENFMLDVIDLNTMMALAAVAMLAGFFDAIAGGGGLITLPALFIAGIPPVAAIATNKFQAAAATISATIAFARKGQIEWRSGFPMALMSLLGGGFGALSISLIPKSALEFLVPILLILVAIYFVLAPKLNNEERHAKISSFLFTAMIAPLIGFYDGVFGPGVGSFFMIACVLLLGQGIVRAMANTKLLNASSNIGALFVFILTGHIIFTVAIAMAIGAFIGAQLGARCAVKFGPKLIKPLLISICGLMAVKLLLDPDNPLRVYISTHIV
jgi:hypothetical protein